MFKGFKDFLLRGNVVDLAVAVIIGAAFSAVVTSFTDKIIRPLLNAITPPTSEGLGIPLVAGKPSAYIDFSAVITATINFIMVAGVVYFAIVLPLKTIQQRRKRGEEAGPADPTDIELLKQIRDLLQIQAGVESAVTKSELADEAEMAENDPEDNPSPASHRAAASGSGVSGAATDANASTVTFERPERGSDGTAPSHRR
jgi:large conductance mechanosensitive channel